MNHIFKTRYKLLKSSSIQQLEDQINEFIDKHEDAIVGNISTQEINQTGMMLCDRIDPNSNYAYIHMVSISYKYDFTKEKMEEATKKWLYEQSLKYSKFIPNGFDKGIDPMSMECISIEDYMKKKLNTEEYKTFINDIEKQYSKED